MKRGTWLLAFGLSSLAAALVAPGCSSSSSNGGGGSSGSADSGPHDGTASSSGTDSSSSSGADTGGQDTGSSSGADSSSSGGDGGSCPAANALPATIKQCVSDHCCTQWTTCAADPSCLSVAQCVVTCLATDGGDGNTCGAKCAADASPTGAAEFQAFGLCLEGNCAGSPGDGGGGEGGGGDGAPGDSGGGG